jgi:hypothetical protein
MMPIDRKAVILSTVCLTALIGLAALISRLSEPIVASIILAIITLVACLISVWILLYISLRRI